MITYKLYMVANRPTQDYFKMVKYEFGFEIDHTYKPDISRCLEHFGLKATEKEKEYWLMVYSELHE